MANYRTEEVASEGTMGEANNGRKKEANGGANEGQ